MSLLYECAVYKKLCRVLLCSVVCMSSIKNRNNVVVGYLKLSTVSVIFYSHSIALNEIYSVLLRCSSKDNVQFEQS